MTRASELPDRLCIRPYAGPPDDQATVDLDNAEWAADGIPERTTVGERAAEYRNVSQMFDARRDVTIVEVGGEPVAFGKRDWVDTTDGQLREYRVHGSVHPDWRRRGIGQRLLDENERLSRELAASHRTERRRVLGAWSSDRQAGRIALLEHNGYERVRWFFDMTRPTLDDVPDLPLPDGLEVRPITPDLVYRVWRADVEAFQDHWGGFDDSDESFRRYAESPSFEPELWVIAFDGEEVAGGVINSIYAEENEALGLRRFWLDSVFTRRPWRRRGLARALIARSLANLREYGMTSAVLGVDADNPTGALGLYESVGFRVTERSTAWRKPLDSEQ